MSARSPVGTLFFGIGGHRRQMAKQRISTEAFTAQGRHPTNKPSLRYFVVVIVALSTICSAVDVNAQTTTAAPTSAPLNPAIDPAVLAQKYPDMTVVTGIGSSSSLPMMRDLSFVYQIAEPKVVINHQIPTWTASSKTEYVNGRVDYFITISLLSNSDLVKVNDTQIYPLVASAVVPVVNIPELGPNDEIWLTRANMVDIYSGAIKYWNDARILTSNANNPARTIIANLNRTITVVVRSDSASTTEVFMKAIVSFSDGRLNFGSLKLNEFPFPASNFTLNGKSYLNKIFETDGVISGLRSIPYSAGFMLWSTSTIAAANVSTSSQFTLKVPALFNKFGKLVRPTRATVQSALIEKAEEMVVATGRREVNLYDGAGPNSWPIAYNSYLLIQRNTVRAGSDCKSRAALAEFFRWFYTSASSTRFVEEYNQLMLPESVRTQLATYLQMELLCYGRPAYFYGIQGVGDASFVAALPVYAATYTLKDPSAALTFDTAWTGTSLDAVKGVGNGSVPFAVLPSNKIKAMSADTDSKSLIDMVAEVPISTIALAVLFSHPDFPYTGGASNATLVLSLEVIGQILAGDIQVWSDPAIRALNNATKLTQPDSISVLLYDTDQRLEYDLLYYALGKYPSIQNAIFDPPTKPGDLATLKVGRSVNATRLTGDRDIMESLILARPYSIALQLKLKKKEGITTLAQLSNNGVVLTGEAPDLNACMQDIKQPMERPASYLSNDSMAMLVKDAFESNLSTCWPMTQTISMILPKTYSNAACADVAPTLLSFMEWYLSKNTSSGALEKIGLGSLPADVKLYGTEYILRSIRCDTGSDGILLGTGACDSEHIYPVVADQCYPDRLERAVAYSWLEPKTCKGGLELLPPSSIYCDYLPSGSTWGKGMYAHIWLTFALLLTMIVLVLIKHNHPTIVMANRSWLSAVMIFQLLRIWTCMDLFSAPTSGARSITIWLDDVCLAFTLSLLVFPILYQGLMYRIIKLKPLKNTATVGAAMIPAIIFLIATAVIYGQRQVVREASVSFVVERDWRVERTFMIPTEAWKGFVNFWQLLWITIGLFVSYRLWSIQKHTPNGKVVTQSLGLIFLCEVPKRVLQTGLGLDMAIGYEALASHILLLEVLLVAGLLAGTKIYTAFTTSAYERQFKALNVDAIMNVRTPEELSTMLNNKLFVRSRFRDYLNQEHAEENLMFLDALQHFKDAKDPDVRQKHFKALLAEFIVSGAPYEINVSAQQKQKIRQVGVSMKDLQATLFEEVEKEIYRLLLDSFRRFAVSEAMRSGMSDRRKSSSVSAGDRKSIVAIEE